MEAAATEEENKETPKEEDKETKVEEWDIDWDWKVTLDDIKWLIEELANWGDLSAKDFDDLRDFVMTIDHKDVKELQDPEAEPQRSWQLPEAPVSSSGFNLF